MKIGILGANGFLGQAIWEHFVEKTKHEITETTRDNYRDCLGKDFDIFINANGNSRKYWANEHPHEDFELSVTSVLETFRDFNIKKYIYISSTDVYNRNNCSYGLNKYLAEQIVVKHANRFLILRCSALIGQGLKKGVVKDLIDNKPLHITSDSRLQFITITEMARIIQICIDKEINDKTIDVAGIGNISVDELSELIGTGALSKECYCADTSCLQRIFPGLKTSKQYIQEFINERMDKSI